MMLTCGQCGKQEWDCRRKCGQAGAERATDRLLCTNAGRGLIPRVQHRHSTDNMNPLTCHLTLAPSLGPPTCSFLDCSAPPCPCCLFSSPSSLGRVSSESWSSPSLAVALLQHGSTALQQTGHISMSSICARTHTNTHTRVHTQYSSSVGPHQQVQAKTILEMLGALLGSLHTDQQAAMIHENSRKPWEAVRG